MYFDLMMVHSVSIVDPFASHRVGAILFDTFVAQIVLTKKVATFTAIMRFK
jgi:hypothetical protein